MRRRVIAEAEADIEQARRFLNQQSSEVANRFFAELEEALERMMEQPSSFPPLETLETDLPIRRVMLRKFPYIVVFKIRDEEVVVLAVPHHSRSLESWIDRQS